MKAELLPSLSPELHCPCVSTCIVPGIILRNVRESEVGMFVQKSFDAGFENVVIGIVGSIGSDP
jgi:hypothetical protein